MEGSFVKALTRAAHILSREFSLTRMPEFGVSGGCRQVRQVWEKWALGETPRGRRRWRYRMAVKSCARIFDSVCPRCDPSARGEARDAWAESIGKYDLEGELRCSAHVEELKAHIRVLVGGWGKRLSGCRTDTREPYLSSDIYVPDQQGCRETKRGEGGTLGTCSNAFDGDFGLVRRGVAKTKGKYRVVTMQSATVKRRLRPIHNALYDHLTSFDWCVRGDVRSEDFLAVCDAGKEDIISGDYKAATDKIYLSAVSAIVEVLAEERELSDEERECLVGSFENLRWQSCTGKEHPIRRGSMMGNLVSFPLLCLLNKACHDIAAARVYGPWERRVGRFNGDDCLFQGSHAMYTEWKKVTSVYGFVVNEEKTMVSRHWADLNSQTFDVNRRRLVSKPVLSFLLPSRDEPGEILSSVLQGISSFRPAVQQWIVNVLMRYEISLRGFTLSSLPSAWCRILVKRKWFRKVVWGGPATSESSFYAGGKPLEGGLPYVDRSFPTVVGPPPVPSVLRSVETLCAKLTKAHTEAWTGVRVKPVSRKLDRSTFRARYDSPSSPLPLSRFVGVSVRWGFLWPKSLYHMVSEDYPQILLSDHETLVRKSYPHSPYLVLQHSYRVTRSHILPIPPPPFYRARSLGSDLLLPILLQRLRKAG